ncbi:MAG: DUF3137 domain-containing protein [Pirellulaceae bacterium]|nr:DUF3137 domain-containing protein [Pirellulaceae bacterium]
MGLLRRLFGPDIREIWQKLCQEIGGDFVEGGAWQGDKVEVRHGQWTIVLDMFHVHTGKVPIPFTRFRAAYVNPDQFRFRVTRRGVLNSLGKLFGAQDVQIGYADFDRDFIIKGNSESKLKALFANERLRQLLSAQPDVHFEVQDDEGWLGPDYPANTDALLFMVKGVVDDVTRLKNLFDLLAETLDQLCLIGSAYEGQPPLKL